MTKTDDPQKEISEYQSILPEPEIEIRPVESKEKPFYSQRIF